VHGNRYQPPCRRSLAWFHASPPVSTSAPAGSGAITLTLGKIIMRIHSILFLMITSCALPTLHQGTTDCRINRHYVGHWSVGPAYSWFSPIVGDSRYFIDGAGLPTEVVRLMNSQPDYQAFGDGPESSIYMEVQGHISPSSNTSGLQTLIIENVISYSKPKRDFIEARKRPSKQ